MILTLNQIISRLKSLGLSHRQINSFYFIAERESISLNPDSLYAAIVVQMLPGSIDRSEHQQRFNFRIYFLDRVPVGQDTTVWETEVISNMAGVAGDFLAMLMNTDYQDDWEIVEQASVDPHTEFLEDMTAGVSIEVGILVDWLADRCVIPGTDVIFEEEIDMPRTRLFTFTAAGTEGNSFTVTSLSGKNVLAVWRAGMYKRLITTTPDDDEKIMVVGTDLGSGRGLLSTTGVVQLNSGDQPILNEKFDFLYYQ